jgi:hypothetical protein
MMICVVFLALLSRAAGLNASDLSLGVRRINEDDKSCPRYRPNVENLLYNIDIEVNGISEGCGDNDLLKIGAILQKVVDDVEKEIPEYESDSMETTVCPLPIGGLATRRGLLLDKSNRELGTARGSYTYKGGGKCKRCRKSIDEARFLQSVEATCLNTDDALFGANLIDRAETVVEAVDDAFLNLKEITLECPNLRAGKKLVIWAREILKECEAAYERALDAVETARDQCQQAKLPTSKKEYQSRMRQVSEAYDTAVGEVNKARNFYFEMQENLVNIDVCNQTVEAPADNLFSLEGQSAVAQLATFAVEMSGTAANKANAAFLELNELVIACGGSIVGAQAIYDSANKNLIASQGAKEQAARRARKCKSWLKQARAAKSKQAKEKRAVSAEKFANQAFLAAESARNSYFTIRDEVERQVYCKTRPLSPIAAPSTRLEPEDDQIPPGQEPKGEETPLMEWLLMFMRMLYDRIPTALSEFPSSETCTLGGIGIYISIDALERPEEEIWLVTKEVCDILAT